MDTEKTVTPITPQEILADLPNIIPSFVFEAINKLLKKKFRGDSVTIKQDDIMAEIGKLQTTYTREEIFDNKWMDFESVYRKNGWLVEYDKPGFNENYDAFFKFTPRKNGTS
jgi:hypothetical protein